MFHYKTHGTCSSAIDLEIEDGIITYCKFTNGCKGNTEGLARTLDQRFLLIALHFNERLRCLLLWQQTKQRLSAFRKWICQRKS